MTGIFNGAFLKKGGTLVGVFIFNDLVVFIYYPFVYTSRRCVAEISGLTILIRRLASRRHADRQRGRVHSGMFNPVNHHTRNYSWTLRRLVYFKNRTIKRSNAYRQNKFDQYVALQEVASLASLTTRNLKKKKWGVKRLLLFLIFVSILDMLYLQI